MRSNDQSRVILSISPEMRAIYDAHFALVWRYMAQRGVRQAQLDDLVHRVFRVVREHPGRREAKLRPNVLACMVARQVLREFRRNNFGFETRAGDTESPTEIFERGAAQELLMGGLETLTEVERDVYLLCEGEGMSTEDVADALGMLESSVQRRRASANKQMHDFVGKLRKTGVWRGSPAACGHDLLEAAQVVCSPTERDSDRVFAAMIAHSMTNPLEFAPTEIVPVPRPASRPASRPSLPPPPLPLPSIDRTQVDVEGPPRLAAQTWPPRVAVRHQRNMLWGAGGALLLTFSLAGYFLSPTNAAEGPRSTSTTAVAKAAAVAPVPAPAAAPRRAPAAALAPASARASAPAKAALTRDDSAALDGKTRIPASKELPAAVPSKPPVAAAVPSKPPVAAAAPSKPAVAAPVPPKPAAAAASWENGSEPPSAKAKAARASADMRAESDAAREKQVTDSAARALKRDQAAEAKLLFAAERNYRGGAPELALEMVANHRRKYPDSALVMEREVLRAQVLCSLARHREVRRIVAELEAANASPAALDAVERACKKDK
jgi:RNA polymerase sigma factor (sigma-70 family)